MQATSPWRGAPVATSSSRRPWITYLLLLAIAVVMAIEIVLTMQGGHYVELVRAYGLIPARFSWTDPAAYVSLVTFNFLHTGARHFGANAVIMLFAGAAIEKHAGRKATLIIWLVGGIVGGIVHLMIFPHTATSLMGASGAISAMLGAALVIGWRWALPVRLWRGRKVLFSIPLPLVTAIWVGFQINSFLRVTMASSEGPSVAYWVHLASFVFGVLCAGALHLYRRQPSPRPVAAHPALSGD